MSHFPYASQRKLILRLFAVRPMVNGSMETTAVIRPEDIGSLTDFARNIKAHLKRLRRTGRPELLTVNGKAEVVVQNASAYQRLIESLEKLNAIIGNNPSKGVTYNVTRRTIWFNQASMRTCYDWATGDVSLP